ncbi:hypothetical protein G6F56_003995 [Rhizopus delemar]|nr:hypothetical protein G6F56_003995 [Rhizopus delemar]
MKLYLIHGLIFLCLIQLVRTQLNGDNLTKGVVNQASTTNDPATTDPPSTTSSTPETSKETPTSTTQDNSPSTTENSPSQDPTTTMHDRTSSSSSTENTSANEPTSSSPDNNNNQSSQDQNGEGGGEDHNNKIATIAGSVVGGLVGIAMTAGILTWINRRVGWSGRTRRRGQEDFVKNNQETTDVFQRRFVPPNTAYMNLDEAEYHPNEYQTTLKPDQTDQKPNQ